jgi:probable rRNA maturation factor
VAAQIDLHMRPFGIEISNRQKCHPFNRDFLIRMTRAAYPACREALRETNAPLATLTGLEATILSDRRIGRVHREFFGDPSPTDVITFHHGEIVLGAGVVIENAARFGRTPDEEAALCLIHGLLHLAGWEDDTPAAAKKMAFRQEQIFKQTRRMV